MRTRLFMILVALAGIGLLIEGLIVTEEERLHAWAEDVSDAVTASDAGALRALFDESFAYEGRAADEAVTHAIAMRKRSGGGSVRIELEQVEIEGATARANALILGSAMGRPLKLRSDVTFRRGEDGWLLTSASTVNWR